MALHNTKNTGIRIAIIYLIVGLLWIFFSDIISNSLFEDVNSIVNFQLLKGAFFVFSTALLIYFLVTREFNRKKHLVEFLNKGDHWAKLIISNIPNVDVYLFDKDGRLIISQGAVLSGLNVVNELVKGMRVEESVLSDEFEAHLKPLVNNVLNGKKVKDIFEYKNRHFQVSGLALAHDGVENFAGLIIITDVTDLYKSIDELTLKNQEVESLYKGYSQQNLLLIKQNFDLKDLNEALISAREKAEESDRLKTSFLTNMSHEIRTPLNGIIGFSQLIASEQVSKEELQAYSKIIMKSGERLLMIINDVLIVAQLESGQFNLKPEMLCFEVLKDEIQFFLMDFFKGNETHRDIVFNFDKSVLQCEASIDKDAVMIILSRLVDNADKFSNDDTAIHVRLLLSNDETLDLVVEDEGIGISENQTQAIFKRFNQLKVNDLMPVDGNGLGLSIVKEVAELMDAEVIVESSLGKGTRFVVKIPIRCLKQVQQTSDLKTAPSLPRIKKILIVEDVVDSFMLIDAYFKNYMVDLYHATSIAEARKVIKQNLDFDLILMDIRLPDGSGIDLIRELRTQQITCPIVAQTAYSDTLDKRLCIEVGCDDYLAKPIGKRQFISTIEQYIDLESVKS